MNESRQTVRATPNEPSEPLRYEPAWLRFGRIVWRHRLLVALGSLLPAVAMGAALYLQPVQYTTTYVYQRPLAESEYNVLLRRFYSAENLAKIVDRLRDKGINAYAHRLDEAKTEQALQNLIRFRVSPAYPARLHTTDPNTSERISLFKARLCYIDITGDSQRDMAGISEVVTDNFENVLPIYNIRNDLREAIQELKEQAAEIEENRFSLTMELKKQQTRLEKLSELAGAATEIDRENLVLEFTDVGESSAFLPLSYQIRAVQSQIIDAQESLSGAEEMYGHYLKVLELNGRLLDEIEENLLTYYTVQDFLDFLGSQLATCDEEELAGHLRSYIRTTQNLSLINTRAGERPMVYPVPKHLLSRSAMVFVIALMIALFVAVVLEYGRQNRGPTPSNKQGSGN